MKENVFVLDSNVIVGYCSDEKVYDNMMNRLKQGLFSISADQFEELQKIQQYSRFSDLVRKRMLDAIVEISRHPKNIIDINSLPKEILEKIRGYEIYLPKVLPYFYVRFKRIDDFFKLMNKVALRIVKSEETAAFVHKEMEDSQSELSKFVGECIEYFENQLTSLGNKYFFKSGLYESYRSIFFKIFEQCFTYFISFAQYKNLNKAKIINRYKEVHDSLKVDKGLVALLLFNPNYRLLSNDSDVNFLAELCHETI